MNIPPLAVAGFLISAIGIGVGLYLPDAMLLVGGFGMLATVLVGLYELKMTKKDKTGGDIHGR